MLEPQAFIPLSSGGTCQIIHASGGSEAEMIEQQKVKLREERESVTWRFQVVLEDSKDQMASTLFCSSSMFFPKKNISLDISHRSSGKIW